MPSPIPPPASQQEREDRESPRVNRHRALSRLKTMWMRLALRGVRYSDEHGKMDLLYLTADPWQMSSPTETYRFERTNQLIADKVTHVGSLLEIGCGEGHQTQYLTRLSDRVLGLDVSSRAVTRARRRCAGAEFLVGDIFSPELDARAPFDVVVASEVLYYINDVRAFIRRMNTLGCFNLVTYFADEMANLDPHVLSQPGASFELLTYDHVSWRAVWWSTGEARP